MSLTSRVGRLWLKAASVLALTAIAALITRTRAAETYSEDAVEAAYLYRFAGYIDWPEDKPSAQPFVIAVLDSPGVARELHHLLPGHRIGNREAEVREVSGLQDVGNAQILYVGPGRAESLRRMLPEFDQRHMLLVTAEERGLDAGSALNFLVIDHRVRFEISLTAADRSGLRISSELLGVAVRVLGGGRQSRGGCSPFYLRDVLGDACAVVVAGRGTEASQSRCRDWIG
jgi:hypothetical protein